MMENRKNSPVLEEEGGLQEKKDVKVIVLSDTCRPGLERMVVIGCLTV